MPAVYFGCELDFPRNVDLFHPAVILATARIVNVQIDAYDLVLRSAALFQLRPPESPSEKFNVCGPGGMYFGQGGLKTLH